MTTIDPSKVKAGDTVTARIDLSHTDDPEIGVVTITGKVWDDYGDNPHGPVPCIAIYPIDVSNVTITDHQPAEPEPEWKPGTVGTATISTCETSGSTTRQHGMWFRRGDDEPLMFMTDVGSSWASHMVDSFAPDDGEHELEALRARLAGSRAAATELRTEITKLTVQLEAANAEVGESEEWKDRTQALARVKDGLLSERARLTKERDAAKAEVERLRAARTLSTREQVAEVLWLNEYQRPWASANREDRAVCLSAAAAVIARMGGAS